MNTSSSLSFTGESTFLKKFKILALFFFAGVFAFVAFLAVLCFAVAGRLLFEFGRGVKGFVDMVEGSERGAEMPCGGVGGRPVEGKMGLEEGFAFARGLRNISLWMVIGASINCNHSGTIA
jgi:hypothetical protein